MRLWWGISSLLGLVGLATAQVHSNQKDLQIQTVWDNMWGVVQLVFLPDDKVMTVHKTGELRIYPSIFAKNTEFKTILDINEEVYSWWDHGLLSAALHPEFPKEPYIFIAYSAEYPGKPWNDNCLPDPKKENMSKPPDTRPYCKSMAKIVRLKLDEAMTKATVEAELMEDWCTSTYTHHVGTILFLEDGSMFYGAGDGSHFQGIDIGAPQDECTDPKGPKAQGMFTVQDDNYLRGKFLVFKPESVMGDGPLVKDKDFVQVAKGARNPFRSTIDPKTGDVYYTEVGASMFEEINRIPNPLILAKGPKENQPNFGWPCVEGKDGVSEIYQNYMRDNGLLRICAKIYAGNFEKPVYQYRFGAVDPDFPEICADADASGSGLVFNTGDKLPEKYAGKLMFVDYSKKCAFWFDELPDGTPDFSQAHAFLYSEKGLTAGGLTDIKVGPDGYIYLADYSGGMVYRLLSADDKSLDAIIAANAKKNAPKADLPVWVETVPGPYEWVYGDTIKFAFKSDLKIDTKTIKWRVTNLHCVQNPCTLEQDCHSHEMNLDEKSRQGPTGIIHPSPHPMESFIRITVSFEYKGDMYNKDFYTHALCYNYKIDSEPQGFPIIFEETMCTATPCIVPMMGRINTGFFIQQIQAKGDDLYAFSHWEAKNLATGKTLLVEEVSYEQVTQSDEYVLAKYVPIKYTDDLTIPPPTGITATGDFQRVQVKWDLPVEGGPDFVLVNIEAIGEAEVDVDTIAPKVVKSAVMLSRRDTAVLELPPGVATYQATTAFYDSKAKKRGAKSVPVEFETLKKAPPNSPIPCVHNPYAEVMKTRTVGTDEYGVAIIGDVPTKVKKGQTIKITIDVQAPKPVDMLVNILSKKDYKWAGGVTIPITAKNVGLQTVKFKVDYEVAKKDFYIHVLLVPPGKDFTATLVEAMTGTIEGIPR